MNSPDKRAEQDFRLKSLASMSNSDILTRSLISGVLFVVLLIGLDWVQSQPIEILETILFGAIFAIVLGSFDIYLRGDARKKLK